MNESSPEVGATIHHYRILSRLGAGGMGEVYLAEDTLLDRKVAIKFLPLESIADEQAKKRLVHEARAAAKLDYPNICAIHEVGEQDGRPFIVMQYIEGETLATRIQREPLDLREVLDLAAQIANALAEAHSRGVIHRDIKPQNVMLSSRGHAKVLDFGLAKTAHEPGVIDPEAETQSLFTAPGAIIGTVPYMSPEQVRGQSLDARSDIFSFGCVLYEMVTGVKPFDAENAAATASAILTKQPPPLARYAPETPEDLQRIARKCLEKDRARRYQTARDLAIDLENCRRECEVAQITAAVSGQITSGGAETRQARMETRFLLTRRWVLVIALVTLFGAMLIYLLAGRSSPVASTPEIKSIAVLPLENLSGDQTQEYFADGMTDALITNLAKIGELRVISRTSVMQYKAVRKPLPEIARELKVDAVLEGSVNRSGDRVRVAAQLIHATTDQHLWAQDYQRDVRDVLALQSEVAQAIASEIKIKLTPQEQARLASSPTVNAEAYDNYLRGKFHLARVNKADSEAAIQMLERAVATDPTFASAYAELARAYTRKGFFFTPQEKQWDEKAFVAVEKALSLDPDLAEAYLARGILLWTHSNHFPHERVVQELHRALTLNPNLDEAHHQLGVVYAHIGLLDEALQELEKAISINPGNTLARLRVGSYLSYQRKYEQAFSIFQGVPEESNPQIQGFSTAWTLFQLGRRDEAAATVEQYLRTNPKDEGGGMTSIKAMLAAAKGDQREAEKAIKTAIEIGKDFGHFHHAAYYIASSYAIMNKPEQAVKWLESAADDGFPCYPLFENDSNLNQIRTDQRFITLMARLKTQWEHYKATL